MGELSTELSAIEKFKLSRASSSLFLYLYIYSLAERECYINHMEGAKALKDWLGEIELPTDTYPEILNTNFKVPSLLYGYQQQKLTEILAGNTYTRNSTIIANAIYFVMSREVITHVY